MKFKLVHAHKFQKIGHSSIVPFAYIGKEETHKYIPYESSMTVYR